MFRSVWPWLVITLFAAFGTAHPVLAADTSPTHAPTALEKLAAAKKFRSAESAYAKKDFARAALEFEESYAIVPHPDALLNAIVAWESAGNALAAAKACQRLKRDSPMTANAQTAEEKLKGLLTRLAQINISVVGEASQLQIDAIAVETGVSIVEPGEHLITAGLAGQPFEKRVNVGPGGTLDVVVQPDPVQPGGQLPKAPGGPTSQWEPPLHTAFFTSAATLTVASGALLIWSGIDTLQTKSVFDQAPSQGLYDEGRAKEVRTNVLIGTTSVLAALTIVSGVFTDWDGKPAVVTAVVAPGMLTAQLHFVTP